MAISYFVYYKIRNKFSTLIFKKKKKIECHIFFFQDPRIGGFGDTNQVGHIVNKREKIGNLINLQ